MTSVLLGIAVFVSALCIDFANTRYVLAVGRGDAHVAARWSIAQWMASLVGFLVAVKYSLWFLPIEACGLYCGAVLALGTRTTPPKGSVDDGMAPHRG